MNIRTKKFSPIFFAFLRVRIPCCYAFWGTSIKEIDIPESVKEIRIGAFNQCRNLETVYMRSNDLIETSFTEVYQAFSNCPNLQKIYVPEHLVEEYKTEQNIGQFTQINL